MNIAIIGSRKFTDYEFLKSEMEKFISEYSFDEVVIVSGGAKGADSLAEKFANEKVYKTLIFQPEWEKYEREACRLRNTQIVENAEVVFAFWDGTSPGTKDSIEKAKKLGKFLYIHLF